MKKYVMRLGDRDMLNEDLKPFKRKSLVHAIIGTIITCIGINQLMKSSKMDGSTETLNNVQTEIDKARAVELMEEKKEEQ